MTGIAKAARGRSLLSLCLACVVPVCQGTAPSDRRSPLTLVPEHAACIWQVAGPARVARQFEKTRLAGLLSSPDVAPYVEVLRDKIEGSFADKLSATGLDAKELLDGLLSYDGKVVIAGGGDMSWVYGSARANAKQGFWDVCVLSEIGGAKRAEAVKRLNDLIEHNRKVELRDLEVQGRSLRCASTKHGWTFVLPFLVGNHAVMVLGDDVDSVVRKVLTNRTNHYPDFEQLAGTTSLALHLEPRPFFDGMSSQYEGKKLAMSGSFEEFLDLAGFSSWKEISLSVGASGERLVADLELSLGRDNRGLWGSCFPERRGPPRLLDFTPVQFDSWLVAPIDFAGCYRELTKLVAADLGSEYTRGELEKKFERRTKLRLEEDLLAHLGGEVLIVWGPAGGKRGPGKDSAGQAAGAVCYGFELRDPAAFAKSFDRLLKNSAMQASRKTESYGPFEVSRFLPLGASPVYCSLTDELFLIAVGEDGGRELRAVLDEVRDRRAGKPRGSMPRIVSERLCYAPETWHGIGVVNLPTSLEAAASAISRQGREPLGKTLDAIATLLGAHDLDDMVVITKTTGGRILTRVIW